MAEAIMEHPLGPPPNAQLIRTIQDVKDCVSDLRNEYEEFRMPLTDDSQILQRFCVKLEYLLQAGFRGRTGILGGKKDYWNYFLDCLGSNRSLNDGIRFVKSISELKTSLGRGRAFLRFALAHQRLADTLQQCIINKKATSDWYQPSSLWAQPQLSSDLIGSLYDINDLQFDLSPRGYDLDTTWPTFARKTFGSSSAWRPPSRSTSISSLSSIPSLHTHDGSFLSSSPLPADPEAEKLRSELTDARAHHQMALDQLEKEKLASEAVIDKEQTKVTSAESRADNAETELKETIMHRSGLQERCHQLEIECEKLKTELNIKEESWADKERSFLHQEQVMLQRLADNEKNQQGSTTGDESSQNLTQEELELLLERLEKMEEQQNADTKSQDQAIRLQEQKHALEITEVKVKLLAQQKRNLALQTESTAVRRELDAKIRVDEKKNELLDLLESKLGQTKKRSQTLDGQLNSMEKCIRDLVEEKKCHAGKLGQASQRMDQASTEIQRLFDELSQEKKIRGIMETTITEQRGMLASLQDKCSKLSKLAREKVLEKVAEVAKLKEEKQNWDEGILLETRQRQRAEKELEIWKKAHGGDRDLVDGSETDEETQKMIQHYQDVVRELVKWLQLQELYSSQPSQSSPPDHQCLINSLQGSEMLSQEIRAELLTLHQRLQDSEADREHVLSQEVTDLREQLRVAKETPADHQKEVDNSTSLQNYIETLVAIDIDTPSQSTFADNETVPQAVMQLHEKMCVLCSTIKDGQEKTDSLTADNASLQSRVTQLQQQVTESNDMVSVTKDAAAHELQQAKLEAAELKTLFSLEETRAADLQRRYEGSLQEMNIISEELERVRQESKALEAQFNNKEHEEIVGSGHQTRGEVQRSGDDQAFHTDADERNKELLALKKLLEEQEKEFNQIILRKNREIEADKQRLDEMESQLDATEKENLALIEKKDEIKVKIVEHEQNVLNLKQVVAQHKSVNDQYQEQIEQLKKEVETAIINFNETEKRYLSLVSDRDSLQSKLSTAEERLKKTQLDIEDHLAKINQLDSEKEKLVLENNQLISVNHASQEDNLHLKNSLEISNQKYTELNESIESNLKNNSVISDALNECSSEPDDKLQELISNKSKLEGLVESLKVEMQVLSNDKMAFSEQISNLNSEVELMSSQVDDKERMVCERDTEIDSLKASITEKNECCLSLEEEISGLKKELDQANEVMLTKDGEYEKMKDSLEQKIKELEEELDVYKESSMKEQNTWTSEKACLTQELSALQFQLSSEKMIYEDALKGYEGQQQEMLSLSTSVTEYEQKSLALQEELNEAQGHSDVKQQAQARELLTLKESLSEQEETALRLASQLQQVQLALQNEQAEVKRLEGSLEDHERLHGEENSTQKIELTQLASDNEQLKKKLIQLLREKDRLWQRAERLEEQRQQPSGWMEDKSTTRCLQCSKEFSFTLRKHHCRMCGKIFCRSCSNNWVMTPHSSKKERVCGNCSLQHSQVEQRSEPSSDVDSDVESSNGMPRQTLENVEIPQKKSELWKKPSVTTLTDSSDDEPEISNTAGGHAALAAELEMADGKGETSDKPVVAEETFDVITQEEIDNTQTDVIPDPCMTGCAPLSVVDFVDGEVMNDSELYVAPGKCYTVPIVISLPGTTLQWEFTTQPKGIHFSVRFQPGEMQAEDEEVLMPTTKCNSHKEAASGQLITRQPGLYTLMFDNTSSKFTSKNLKYTLQLREEPAES